MTTEIMNNEDDENAPWNIHLKLWRARLKQSAASLHQLSGQLLEIINDERRFAILTDIGSPNITLSEEQEYIVEDKEFDRIFEQSMAVLVDLQARSNPDREFPDLSKWYKFECPNVEIGKITDLWEIVDGKITKVTTYQSPSSVVE